MLKLFTKYASVGVINTAIHWSVFLALIYTGADQSFSNLIAFCISVTFSFFANAKWTFKSTATSKKFLLYIVFMGSMASLVGYAADEIHLNPIVTLVSFSLISLIIGFIYSRVIIFRGEE